MAGPVQEKRQRGRPRLPRGPEDAASVQSLDRAIALLGLVADGNGLSLTEAASLAGLAPSTTYRMLSTLERHGMVEFDPGAQLWHIGTTTFRIGSAFLRRRKIADRGREAMQRLVECCGETANLAVAVEDGVVFVSQVETHEAIRAFFRPGTQSPYHASGVGKAILARLPPERVAAIAARSGLPRFTATTLTRLPLLNADLARIRARGWSLDDEERHLGMRCVGAAILNEFGEPMAGISISGPTVRLTEAAVAEAGPLVAAAAREVTRAMGGVAD